MSEYLKAAKIVVGTFCLDGLFHASLTEPFETGYYFLIKSILVFGLALALQRQTRITTHMDKSVAGAIAFSSFWGIYYRGWELANGLKFGSRAPDLVLGSHRVTYEQDPLANATGWGIAHFLAFFIPAYMFLD